MLAIVFSLMKFKPRVSPTLIQRLTLDLLEGHWTTLQIPCKMSSLYVFPKDHVAIIISQGDIGETWSFPEQQKVNPEIFLMSE